MIIIISLLVIKVYILNISSTIMTRDQLLESCPDFGEICDANISIHCCSHRGICRSHRVINSLKSVFLCMYPVTGKDFCQYNTDCTGLGQSICNSEFNQCECLHNHRLLEKRGKCMPLIGGYCTDQTDCKILNTICAENTCKCRKKFIVRSQNQCVLSSIGRKCAKDLDCDDLLHIGCSVGKKCVCKDNHILINNLTCMPLLDEFCWSDERCAVDNSVCFKNKCRCKSDYTAIDITHCIKLKLGKLCNSDEDCSEVLHAVCSLHKRCICEENYLMLGTEECRKPS